MLKSYLGVATSAASCLYTFLSRCRHQQGQALALGPNCTLLTADGRPLVGRDGDFLFLGKDGKSLVDRGE